MEDRRIAVVTGASRGLGSAFTRVLAEEGFAVALGARDVAGIERLAAGLPVPTLAHPLDVGAPAATPRSGTRSSGDSAGWTRWSTTRGSASSVGWRRSRPRTSR